MSATNNEPGDDETPVERTPQGGGKSTFSGLMMIIQWDGFVHNTCSVLN